ncbi:hypothetical protein DPMN_121690 [Dreissena polymorpha]|uniref:Uncharacterized protein n=1 Tax=Dreissena polymorpha TaxID=45954 RepID=A0A9D4GM30_DREPO|nr:hypothetical protein DPMN_121690 [Dreissena polymorpha]
MQFRPVVSPSPFTGSVTLVNCYICIFPLTGVGGNLVAVQASRISTSLHKVCRPGNMPVNMVQGCPNCMEAFIGTCKFVLFFCLASLLIQ